MFLNMQEFSGKFTSKTVKDYKLFIPINKIKLLINTFVKLKSV